MHVKTLGAVSALALFAGVSAGAFAQAPGGGQSQGAQERLETPGQSAPGQKQMAPAQRKGQSAEEPGQRKGQQAQEPGLRKGQQAQQPGERKGQQAQEPGERKGQQAEKPGERKGQQAQEQRSKKQEQAEEKQGKRQKQTAEQPERKQQKQRAEQPESKQRAEQPSEGKQKQQAQQPSAGKEQQAGRGGGRIQLSEQQRTTVRERFRESGALERARVNNVNFNISVGTKVPRGRVHLATLPTVIVEEVPAYRGYDYFVVRDEIVIVNPRTYVIVDVIKVGGGQTHARLSLSPEQRRVVLSHVDLQPSVRLGIGEVTVGMDVPQQVELRSFPAVVVQDVPELRSYRYFVFENEVAIVDPQQRDVILTISQ